MNVSSRIQVWEQQNNDSGLGTREQRLRTGKNITRTQDWEQQNKGSGLGTTEQGFRTPQGLGPAGNWYTPKKRMVST